MRVPITISACGGLVLLGIAWICGYIFGRVAERNAMVRFVSETCVDESGAVRYPDSAYMRCRNCGETTLQRYDTGRGAYVCDICGCETRGNM